MKKILFTDLDDTLFQSHRKAPPGADWMPLAHLPDGAPISWASPAQQALLQCFMREMTVIPVTARNQDAFRRVRIPFAAEAIINYGGVILDAQGAPEEEWLEKSRQQAQQAEDGLGQWLAALEAENSRRGDPLRIRLIRDFAIPFYGVAKSPAGDEAAVRAAAAFCRQARDGGVLPDLFLHLNGNNLALIPRWLNKSHAVAHLCQRYRARHGPVLTLGMGDSLVDLDFLAACDYQITPSQSQIAGFGRSER